MLDPLATALAVATVGTAAYAVGVLAPGRLTRAVWWRYWRGRQARCGHSAYTADAQFCTRCGALFTDAAPAPPDPPPDEPIPIRSMNSGASLVSRLPEPPPIRRVASIARPRRAA